MKRERDEAAMKKALAEQWIEGIKGRTAYMEFRINVKYAEAFEVVKHIMNFRTSILGDY